jgi:hypothetical protein
MTENSVIRDAELYRSLVLLAAATTLILLTVRRLRPGHPRAVPADVHRALVRSLLRKLAPPVLLVVAGVEVHYWAELAASRSGSTTWNNTTGIAQVVAILCLPWLGMRAVAMWIYLTSVDGEAPSDARVGTITAQGVRTLLGRRVTAVELSVQGQVWTAETATFVPSPGQNDSFLFPGQAVLVYWRYRRASRPLVVISTTQQPVQLLTGIWRRRTSIRQGNRQPSQVATKATRFTRNG